MASLSDMLMRDTARVAPVSYDTALSNVLQNEQAGLANKTFKLKLRDYDADRQAVQQERDFKLIHDNHAQLKEAARGLMSEAERRGINPDTPDGNAQFQQMYEEVKPQIATLMGDHFDAAKPADVNAIRFLAGPSENEQLRQKLAIEQPGKLEVANAMAGNKQAERAAEHEFQREQRATDRMYADQMKQADRAYQTDVRQGERSYQEGRDAYKEQREVDKAKKVVDANAEDVMGAADEALKILSTGNPTGSGAGALVDKAGNFIGVPTAGSIDTGRLKTLTARMVSKMPKSTGAQTDRDIELAYDAAGNADDDTLPLEKRIAAVNELVKTYSRAKAREDAIASGNPFQEENSSDGFERMTMPDGTVVRRRVAQ